MKSCGRAKGDKLAISLMKKGRMEAGGDDGREEDKKREKERHLLYYQLVFLSYVLFIFTLFGGFFNGFHVQKGLHGKEYGKH
jgi:hypothetical protein